ncbi:MAG TPA: Na/Pi symporter [Rhodocyclaceae bacterium]|nr:Na/Pi symporter [Rhodocyclaceae bacterium]
MDIFANLFAGIGLFFIGIRLIGNHLKQLASRRMRLFITRAISGKGSLALFGLASGAIMQSVNAVTYVLAALATAGAIETRRAFPIVSWANIGTSMLVIVAAINMHLLILLLIGIAGITFYLHLDQSARYRHAIGALLGIGLLFLGIDFIKSGSAILKNALWLKDYLAVSANYPILAFSLGAIVALVAQSSSTITVIAMAMAASGLLVFEAGAMVVVGAGLGSALSAWTLAGRMEGSSRQLVLYQIVLRGLGVVALVLVFLIDGLAGRQWIYPTLSGTGLSPSAQLATVYVVLQVASDLVMRVMQRQIVGWIEKSAPPSDEEVLGRPHYLRDDAMVESESALLLVEKEQQRLLTTLPLYLAPLRAEADQSGPTVGVRYAAERNVFQQCAQFLTEIADRNHSRLVLEQTIVLRDRNDLLGALQETLAEIGNVAAGLSQGEEVRTLIDGLVESLHMMLELMSEAAQQGTKDDVEMLLALTHDRSELMDGIRRRLQGGDIPPEVQQAAFSATTLFERCVWLLRRYVLLLDIEPAE